MSEKSKREDQAQCEVCGEMANPDMEFWPPKKEGDNMLIHYKCPNGHKFVRKLPLKRK